MQSLCLWRTKTEKDRTNVEESSVITEIRALLCRPRKQQGLLTSCFQPSEDNFGLLTSIMWDNEPSPGLHCVGGWRGTATHCFFCSLFLFHPRLAWSLACSRGQHWMPHPPAPVPESWDSRHGPLCWFMQYSGSNPGLPACFARQVLFQLSYSPSLDSVFKD